MKKIKRILILIIIGLMVFSSFNISMAAYTIGTDGSGGSGGGTTSSGSLANKFGGTAQTGSDAGKKVKSLLSTVLEIVRNIGIGIAIIMLITLACKYMISSAADRAEIKKHAITYVIGAVVLFAASGILTIIKNFVIEVTGN